MAFCWSCTLFLGKHGSFDRVFQGSLDITFGKYKMLNNKSTHKVIVEHGYHKIPRLARVSCISCLLLPVQIFNALTAVNLPRFRPIVVIIVCLSNYEYLWLLDMWRSCDANDIGDACVVALRLGTEIFAIRWSYVSSIRVLQEQRF